MYKGTYKYHLIKNYKCVFIYVIIIYPLPPTGSIEKYFDHQLMDNMDPLHVVHHYFFFIIAYIFTGNIWEVNMSRNIGKPFSVYL